MVAPHSPLNVTVFSARVLQITAVLTDKLVGGVPGLMAPKTPSMPLSSWERQTKVNCTYRMAWLYCKESYFRGVRIFCTAVYCLWAEK